MTPISQKKCNIDAKLTALFILESTRYSFFCKQLEETETVSMLGTMETSFHLRKGGDEGIS